VAYPSKLITLQSQQRPQRPKIIHDPSEPAGFRWIVSITGFTLLLILTWLAPLNLNQLWYTLLIGLFVAFQVIFPLYVLASETHLGHVITLGGGLLFGPVVAGWAYTLGVALGFGIRWFESRKWGRTPLPPPVPRRDVLAMIGIHHIALLVALTVFGFWSTRGESTILAQGIFGKIAPALLLFAGLHLLLFLMNTIFLQRKAGDRQRDLVNLALIELLPLPFIWIAVMSYPLIGLGTLVVLGGVPAILEMLFYGAYSLRQNLERRSKELDTLNQISQALRASFNLEQLLEEIQNRVSALFSVENFYIALYNPDADQLWYPLAVKNYQRVHWQPRPLADRLTDRVIRERAAILLPHDARDALASVGMPAGEDSPTAWMGVPLIASDRVIGCLGVFSFSPKTLFTKGDISWLTTLSGQVSIAIESTLRYQRTQRRTDLVLNQRIHQLSILETVGRELTADIRSDRLMDIILEHALEVTGSDWGSITLYDPLESLMTVKALHGYQEAIASLSAKHGITGRAARSGQRIYLPDVSKDPDYVDLTGGAARSQLCMPLVHAGRVLGVLTLENDQFDAYSPGDQAFINQLTILATVALVNAEMRIQARERLNEVAAVLNGVGEGLLVVDDSGGITQVNEAMISFTGLPPSEFVGKRLIEISERAMDRLGYTHEQLEWLVDTLGQGQLPSVPPARLRLGEPTNEKVLERTSHPVRDQRGRVTGWLIVLANKTDEIQVSQAKELITETLVHDLRSPASAVMGALDVLEEALSKDEIGNDEMVVQSIQVARRAAQRMLGMTESLLEIARLQAGKTETSLASIHLRSLVASVLNDFMPESLEYGIILRNEIREEAPAVCADLAKTTRVLTNLVDNAVKFTPSGGQVIISMHCLKDGMVTIQVSDTGPGVPEEYREKIFDRFSQVPGLVGRRRGSGLGLTFCRLALDSQGGKIWVEPRPGGGSIFTFTLPAFPASG
jgi:NtrC-family two-component system sensor histidine kinase KinB